MADHFSLMKDLYYRLGCLDGAQEVIDANREIHPDNQEMQLMLDRKQTEIDEERCEVRELLVVIPMSN